MPSKEGVNIVPSMIIIAAALTGKEGIVKQKSLHFFKQ